MMDRSLKPLSPDSSVSVPLPLTPLVGRDDDVKVVETMLRQESIRLITLTGPGGVGKTRLAVEVAFRAADLFEHGVIFVSLAPIRDPVNVLPTIAQALDLRDMGGQPLAERLVTFLRPRHQLLVLDNYEQILPAAPLITELLTACPGLAILVTSRARLRLSGEHDIPVAPLSLPDTKGNSTFEHLSSAPATRLFAMRAKAVNPAFILDESNIELVVTICARLDGLPLAMELAAARIDHLPLKVMAERLERRLPLLTGGPRDLPARLQTMRDAIGWSYELLDPHEQRFFRCLSVFQGGFGLEEAERIVVEIGNVGPDEQPGALDLIASLLDKSLLRREEREGDPRYRMLETIREFGQEQLAERGELDQAQRAHAGVFLELAERAAPEWQGASPRAWLDRLEADRNNFRAALRWTLDEHEVEIGSRFAVALFWFWRIRGPVAEGRQWMEEMLELSAPLPPILQAALMTRLGGLFILQGDLDFAAELLDTSIALAEVHDDRSELRSALGFRGLAALHQGDLDLAAIHLERALELARADRDTGWMSGALGSLATVARRRGDDVRESVLLEEALRVCQDHKLAWYLPSIISQLADVALERNDLARANQLYLDALGQFSALGELRNVAATLAGFAWMAAFRGEAERAAQLCGAVEALLDRSGVNLAPHGQIRYEHARSSAREALGETAFETIRATGRRLTPERILAEEQQFLNPSAPEKRRGEDVFGLTERELTILRLLPSFTYREIANRLFISERTVEHHVHNLCAKLGVRHRRQAVEVAKQHDLIPYA
jgi:predicted ATPase/DNA-binding CsgD family transcriptional regulator